MKNCLINITTDTDTKQNIINHINFALVLSTCLGKKHAVPHNRHPQVMLSEFDETWYIRSRYVLRQEIKYFKRTSISGVRAPSVASFNFLQCKLYVNRGNLICLSLQKCFIKTTLLIFI